MQLAESARFSLFQTQSAKPFGGSLVLAAVAGVLQACSLAWPWSGMVVPRGQTLWWLQLLALAGLTMLLRRATTASQAAWLGWTFAWTWLAATFAWLYTSMHQFGGLAAPLAVLAVLALAGTLALYYALAAWWFWRVGVSTRPAALPLQMLLFASVWVLAEMGRGLLFTGFGWGAVGYAQLQGPLEPWLPYLGLYGLCAWAAGLALALGGVLQPLYAGRLRAGLLSLLLLTLTYALPASHTRSQGTLTVSLLQGGIAQGEKFDNSRGIPQALAWYGEQLQASDTSLVITPETALPVLPAQLPQGYWARLQARFAQGDQAALIGMPLGSLELGYSNSVLGLKPGQDQPWRYDKHHLVPFGEFIPPLFRWFTDLMHIPLGDFQRGDLAQAPFDWAGQRLAGTVCYENLFSEELAVQFAQDHKAPTIFFNVSNLAWFGEHLAMDQHLHIARTRALEFERPFLLATNTGITGIVDHRGQLVQLAPRHQAVVLRGQVEGRTGLTPYAFWMARWGLWPLVLLALLGALLPWAWRRR